MKETVVVQSRSKHVIPELALGMFVASTWLGFDALGRDATSCALPTSTRSFQVHGTVSGMYHVFVASMTFLFSETILPISGA